MRRRWSRPQWLAGTESESQKTRAESKRETPRVNAAGTYAWAIAGGACSKMRAQTNSEATQTGCSAGTKQKWKTGTGAVTRGAAAVFS
jgi:hypothetical protein